MIESIAFFRKLITDQQKINLISFSTVFEIFIDNLGVFKLKLLIYKFLCIVLKNTFVNDSVSQINTGYYCNNYSDQNITGNLFFHNSYPQNVSS